MSRGTLFSRKAFAESQPKFGGAVPIAKLFLPQHASALPIRLAATGSRRIAEARPRRPT
jgi:hypothetical protein